MTSRAAGILLHPTSLPGPGGIGSIGNDAFQFVDFLHEAGMRLWQVLPLGPTGYADSPYAGLSALAGNPLLIDIDILVTQGLLEPSKTPATEPPPSSVDFGAVGPAKLTQLRKAFQQFKKRAKSRDALDAYVAANSHWLDQYALFMALKDAHGLAAWDVWDVELRRRTPAALQEATSSLAGDIDFHRFTQFVFANQWTALREYAHRFDISIVGDIPIFVAYDSADVWANQHQFRLDDAGHPEFVAGVPPDYFSRTGQLWGNPQYRWEAMAEDSFRWWIDRFRALMGSVDMVRLDHFRGFVAAWWVPYGSPTAETGEWVPSPGRGLFQAVQAELGNFPVIAEDLGVITADVVALREELGFPGMKILQFAFGGDAGDPGLPHNYDARTCVYTGTHDNETTVGWFSGLPLDRKEWVERYLGNGDGDISWALIRLALASVADLAIVPMQDILRLGNSARMNVPGTVEGNWGWRFDWDDVTPAHAGGLRVLVDTYGR